MTKFSGRLVRIGLARESTRGVGEAPDIRLPHTDISFASKISDVRVGPALGRLADSEQHHILTKFAEGDISGEVRSQSFGYLLYALTGTHSVAGPTDTAAYTHSFTPLDNSAQHDTLTITVQDENHIVAHELAALQSLEIECPLDNVAAYSSSWMARTQQPSGHHTPPVTSELKFPKNKTTVKLASTIAGLATASTLCLKRFRISFNKNLTTDDCLGTIWPDDFLVGSLGVEGEFEIAWDDQTFRDYYLDGTERAVQFQLVSAVVITDCSTTYATLTIQLPNCDFFGWEPNRPLDDLTTQTVSFRANFDVANDQEIIHDITLVCGKDTYA